MIISDRHGFIFVHVPKSGGTSCAAALRLLLTPKELKHWAKPGTSKHVTLRQVKRRMDRWAWWPFLPRRFEDYFKFGFVRNPWARLVSLFHYLKETAAVPEARTLTSFGQLVHDMHAGAAWIEKLHSTKPQLSYFQDEDGRLLVDFVGRYEDLAADFRAACVKIGIEAELPHLNRSSWVRRRKPYQDYYTSETQELVHQRFRADIEHFGYTFAADSMQRVA